MGLSEGNQVTILTYELEDLEARLNHNIEILGDNTDAHKEYLKRLRELNDDEVMSEKEKNNRKEEIEKEYREIIAKQIEDGSYQNRNPGVYGPVLQKSAG
jgi:hypothetical protein